MGSPLHDRLLAALTDRSDWERRQRVWYDLRHTGLPRRNKPFAGAAEMHFPMIDTCIEKLKPFYLNAIFSQQLLVSFTALQQQLAEATAAAAEWMDWRLKNGTNFEEEMGHLIDMMLLSGRVPMKQRWDNEAEEVRYEAIDPLFFIVPKRADKLEDMDFFAHVKSMSVAQYERCEHYQQGEDYLARIRGSQERDQSGREQSKAQREGLTYSTDEDEVIVWEVWEKVREGWRVHTYSPCAPKEPMRAPFVCAYKTKDGPMLPFTSFGFEVKDKGWYSPRGVAERMAPFETYCTKLWNAKADWLEYCMKPLFTSTEVVRNTANTRLAPGEILPPGLEPARLPDPPMSLDQEVQNTRLIGEQSLMMPDFGVAEEGRANKTATEVDYIRTFASQGVQYRGRLSYRSLGDLYRKTWALYVQYGAKDMSYWSAETRKVLPQQALHDNYLIQPDGSPDQWNKQARVQRSLARYQMFRGHPNVNQEELVKSVLEDDDPRLVKRLYISANVKSGKEAEDEAVEILLLMAGFPATVDPSEDHALRIRIIAGKLQQLAVTGAPLDPVARQRLQEHLVTHLQMLKQQNPTLAKQIEQALHVLDSGPAAQPAPALGSPPSPQTPAPEASAPVAGPFGSAPMPEPDEMEATAL